ncbi:MAG: thiamine diphosphokinase [Coprobacillus cateniformis]|uniref:thiamine diphosphokinase n=1 Tax=Longibaculum muris TaxID=1796628 RepID=UPI003AB41171|nr:thiamine diphosphokinase [Coprobacillus cateniformis]
MKIGIYCSLDAGAVKDRSIEYIGVDQGVTHLYQQGILPIIAIGDMDSIENKQLLEKLQVKLFSSIKDDTDTALAIDYALDQGYDEIEIYGVTQKRMDHFMAVLCLLEKYQDIKITVYDQWNKISVLNAGVHYIDKGDYHYFSVFAFDESVISLKECHYPLDHYHLKRSDPLCVSNQMNDDYAIIENNQSILLIQSK